MDIIREREQVSRLEIVDSGRRRGFSDEAKLAIVAESLSALRQVTVIPRPSSDAYIFSDEAGKTVSAVSIPLNTDIPEH